MARSPGRSDGCGRPAAARSQLLIAPPDLRTADPTVAVEIYAGRFAFAGHVAETSGESPFDIGPPSEDWLRELHSFGWLRHLRAADTPLARSNARAIVEDWLALYRRPGGEIVWDAEVAARRALSFLAQSPLVLHDADHDLYQNFVRSLLAPCQRAEIRHQHQRARACRASMRPSRSR